MNHLINRTSIIKQKYYCNVEGFIYTKHDHAISEGLPKIDIEIVVLRNEHDLKNYSNIYEIRKNQEKYRYLLQKGCDAYLAFHNMKIASCIWTCDINQYHPYLYLDHPIFQGKHNYYAFNIRTRSTLQRKGIFTYLYSKIIQDISKNENTKIFSLIHLDNLSSQKAHEQIGFEKLGYLSYKKIFGVKIVESFKEE